MLPEDYDRVQERMKEIRPEHRAVMIFTLEDPDSVTYSTFGDPQGLMILKQRMSRLIGVGDSQGLTILKQRIGSWLKGGEL